MMEFSDELLAYFDLPVELAIILFLTPNSRFDHDEEQKAGHGDERYPLALDMN
jgi:hypothetical protein